ncbi:MAG: hypothetical protein U9N59_15200 [Campylobacterota bacterium]|nr:hypothetical protein [Campylobacterota bacterium]
MTPLVKYDNEVKTLSLKLKDDKTFDIKLHNPNYRSFGGQCIQNKYRLIEAKHPEYGYLYIDHIALKSACGWNGLPSGYFEQMAKRIFKAEDVKKLSTTKVGNYEFTEYQAYVKGKEMIVSIIEIWGAKQNTFIIDPDKKLTKELKAALEKSA